MLAMELCHDIYKIKIIKKRYYEGDTPSSVLRTALFWPRLLRTAIFFASRTAYRLTTKTTFVGASIHIKWIK